MAWPLGATIALAFVQFAGDLYISDPDRRRELIQRLRPRLSRLLIIDRPAGFSGHGAGEDPRFARALRTCLAGIGRA